MNPEIFKQSRALRHTRRLATLFLLLCASLPAARAKDHKQHTSAAVEVIASMSFDKKPPADMMIQRIKGKPYLFVQLANAQGVVVVDISKPDKPKIVSSLSDPDTTGTSQLSIHGNAAVMTTVADGPGPQAASKGELVLWDISEPGNPRVVQRFSGVVRVLRDERNYTYILNQDGLWVVYDNQNQPATEDKNWLLGMFG